jgi:hypothetical protein
VRTHASFTGRFSKDRDEDDGPPGGELAQALATGLEERGLTVLLDETDYSFALDISSPAGTFFGMVGLVDDGDREWLVFVEPSHARKLFGKRPPADVESVLGSVHEVLSADDRVSALRWYTEEEWNTNPEGGASSPAG